MNEEQGSLLSENHVSSPRFLGILWILTGIPLVWIGFLLLDKVYPILNTKSLSQLKESKKSIQEFHNQEHRLPESLAEVRIFAEDNKIPFTAYDRYGQRLSYSIISEKSYVLQSFGREQSTTARLDQSMDFVMEGIDNRTTGVQEKNLRESLPTLYQPAFLEGLLNSQGSLKAQLYLNPKSETRTLLVTSPKNSQWVKICSHDKPYEFLWLKSGHELIFIAEKSARYDAGLYYWNVLSGEQKNIWPHVQEKIWPQLKEDQDFYVSLSHVSVEPPLLYFVAVPSDYAELDPKKFYSFENLYAITVDHTLQASPETHRIPSESKYSIFDYPLHQAQWTKSLDKGNKRQSSWASLPLQGDPDSVLTSWQDFGSEFELSSLTPYHLWWLASLYNDSYRYLTLQKRTESRVVRNFGIEMAEALEQMILAPSYLKAMGNHLKKTLLLSKPADYNVAQWNSNP